MGKFIYVGTRGYSHCVVCGKSKDCRHNSDGLYFCKNRTIDDQVEGYRCVKERDGSGVFSLWVEDDGFDSLRRAARKMRPRVTPEEERRRREAARYASVQDWKTSGPGRDAVPVRESIYGWARLLEHFPRFVEDTLDQLPILYVPNDGWNRDAWAMPEWNGQGDIIGYNLRYQDGSKLSAGSRGIIIPKRLRDMKVDSKPPWEFIGHKKDPRPGAIYIVEGASDVLAMCEMGIDAIGRPSNTGGAEDIAEWIKKHLPRWRWENNIIVVGENDQKADGRWPGREGAVRVAHRLTELLGCTVGWAMPPCAHKDVRDWYEDTVRRKSRPSGWYGLQLRDRLYQSTTWLWVGCELPKEAMQPKKVEENVQPEPLVEPTAEEKDARAKAMAEWRAEKAAEREAARHIHAARRDNDRYCCRRPRNVILQSLRTGAPWLFEVRCERWDTCPGCRRYLVERELTNARLRFAQAARAGQQLYELNCPAEHWASVSRALRRSGGEHIRVFEAEGLYYIVTDKPVESCGIHGIPVTPENALGTVKLLLDEYCGSTRPVSTSHGWRLPRDDEEEKQFTRLGKGASNLTPSVITQAAEAVGAVAVPKCYRDGRRVLRAWRFDRDDDWQDQNAFETLLGSLFSGDVLPLEIRGKPLASKQDLEILARYDADDPFPD